MPAETDPATATATATAGPSPPDRTHDHAACDVLVVGSGASGLTAAATAAIHGLSVIVTEKADVFGGTTALSEGMIWIPANHQAKAAGIADTAEAALAYITETAGPGFDPARARAFVTEASRMLAFVERHTHLRYILAPGSFDYHPELAGALTGGRSLNPAVFDGRRLGAAFPRLRSPLATTMILGGMSIAGEDVGHFFRLTRSWTSVVHVAGMMLGHFFDRLRGYARGTRIGNGNGLVAALVLTLIERGVPIWTDAPVTELIVEQGRVSGARLVRTGRPFEVRASRGVVLACGGFTASDALRERFFPHVSEGKNHQRIAPRTNTGDGLALAQKSGAALRHDQIQPAAWSPVSRVPRPDGSTVPFPHYIDRAKPGIIAVDRRGRRFVNEADSYHMFVPAMVAACRDDPAVEVFLVADHAAIRRYGLGVVPPKPGRLGPHLRSGYLIAADSLRALAASLAIDADGFDATVRAFNDGAARGEDPAFARGVSAYNRANGDPDHRPNPSLGALATPPFYAVRLVPGDIGTFTGLSTDTRARVLDKDEQPLPGLYAVGNDMASPMGGAYPGAGITIGSGMTYGFIAANHLARA